MPWIFAITFNLMFFLPSPISTTIFPPCLLTPHCFLLPLHVFGYIAFVPHLYANFPLMLSRWCLLAFHVIRRVIVLNFYLTTSSQLMSPFLKSSFFLPLPIPPSLYLTSSPPYPTKSFSLSPSTSESSFVTIGLSLEPLITFAA